jgi:hypothetical protein
MASMAAGMAPGVASDDWSQNPIHSMFAATFPNADQHARELAHRMSNSAYAQPLQSMYPQQQAQHQNYSTPPFASVNYHSQDRARSTSLPDGGYPSSGSTPPLSPSASETPQSHHTPTFPPVSTMPQYGTAQYSTTTSPFTAQLPGNIRMMGVADPYDPIAPELYGADGMGARADAMSPFPKGEISSGSQDYYGGGHQPSQWDVPAGTRSGMDTPGEGSVNWDSWIQYPPEQGQQ